MTHRALGHSSYYIAHGVEPLLPFDLTEATFMVPLQSEMMTMELIALRAQQLEKRQDDLTEIHDCVLRACFASIRQFEKHYTHSIKMYKFTTGNLILVQNSHVEMSLDRKTKPRWIGPMVVVRQTKGGSYVLSELDGSVSKLCFTAFHVILYHARKHIAIDPESFFKYPGDDNEEDEAEEEEEESNDKETSGGESDEEQ